MPDDPKYPKGFTPDGDGDVLTLPKGFVPDDEPKKKEPSSGLGAVLAGIGASVGGGNGNGAGLLDVNEMAAGVTEKTQKINGTDIPIIEGKESNKNDFKVDEEDPINSFLKPLQDRKKQLFQRNIGIESTGQNKLNKQGVSNEVNNINDASYHILNEAFPKIQDAKNWLATHPDTEKNVTSKVANSIVQDNQVAENSIKENNGNLKQAALQYYTNQDNQLGNQLKVLKNENIAPPPELEGELVHNFLQNRTVKEYSQSSQQAHDNVKEQSDNFYLNYPQLRAKMILSKIAQGREDLGYNNWFLNLPGKNSSDEIVDKLTQKGDLTPFDQKFYHDTGLGALSQGLPTPGLMENTFQSAGKAIGDIPKSVYELSGLRNLMTSKGNILYNDMSEDLSQPEQPKYKGFLHQMSNATGNLAGVVLPIAGEAKGIEALNLVKNAEKANELAMGLTFYHDIQKQETENNPDNPMLAHLSAMIQSAVWMKMNPGLKSLSGAVIKESAPEINDILKNLQSGEIENNAAQQQIINTVMGKAKQLAGKGLQAGKESLNMATQVAAATSINNAVGGILSGRFDLDQNVQQTANSFKSMLLGSPLLSVMKVAGQRNMAADQLNDIAEYPDQYSPHITTPEQKENLQHLLDVHESLKEREDLKPEQKKKVQLLSLNQKVLEDKIKNSPDKSLSINDEKQVKAIEIEKEKVVNPDMGNKKFVEEMYHEDLLPKGSRMLLEDEKGKFSEHKVGDYLKFIAQQANHLDENWQPHEGKAPSMDKIPQQIVDVANERWAKQIKENKEDKPPEPIIATPPENVAKPENKVKQLETEKQSAIDEAHKPDIKLPFIKAEDLVSSKDPVKFKQQHSDIKDRFKKLKEVVNCIWS